MRSTSPRAAAPAAIDDRGHAKIRIGVFDEHEIFRRGLVACLGEDPLVTVVAQGTRPVVTELLDVAVVSVQALEAGRLGCPLVVCSNDGVTAPLGDNPDVFAVLPHHAARPEQVLGAIRAAAVGLRIMPVTPPACGLDERATAVVRLLAAGASTPEIAETLGYCIRTIKNIIGDVERALGCRSRTHLVAEAVRRQLV
jgi:DNA-binding CsgD family transcriptional regulator